MNFREDMRYEYPLDSESLVVDVGAHKGTFSREIIRRYNCKVIAYEPIKEFYDELLDVKGKLQAVNAALGWFYGIDRFGKKGDMSGSFAHDVESEEVQMMDVVGEARKWGSCDLLKLNCEGLEFAILEQLIMRGDLRQFANIQVQFHPVVPEFQKRYDAIRAALLSTHQLTYDFPWCWQNFEIK